MHLRHGISFTLARRLSIGLLLGLLAAISLVYALVLHSTIRRLSDEHVVLQQKVQHLCPVPLYLGQVGTRMSGHDPRKPMAEADLLGPLDEVREHLTQLSSLPLSPAERGAVEGLASEERRLRTVAYAFVNHAGADPTGDRRGKIVEQIQRIGEEAVVSTHAMYDALSSEMRRSNEALLNTLERARLVLAASTLLAIAFGIGISVLLGRSLSLPISRILAATRAIGEGNFSHRINSKHQDQVGQLANAVDGMAGKLQDAEKQLRRAVSDMQSARDAADQANSAKSLFLANMSHEIRTPMTSILGFSDLLLDPSLSDAERESHVQTIRRNGEHLLAIINDVLDLSKVEAGKLKVERIACSPRKVIEAAVQLLRPRATVKGLDISVEVAGPMPAAISCDPVRLQQILVNLLGNAVKFTEHGTVMVSARIHNPDGAPMLRIDVVDTGIGMSAEQVSLLFQPFSQADASTTRRFGGTGLGLAISRELARLLGGDVTVQSQAGRGSTFTLMVRAEPAVAAAPAPATEDASRLTTVVGARILLAEDGEDNQRLIAHVLRTSGAEVTIAGNGLVACRNVREALAAGRPFDLILMDMQMPEMDGYAATAQLRQTGIRTPVVALTACAMDGDRQRCIEAGCDDYAAKPIQRERLLATIQTQLARAANDSRIPAAA